MSPSAVASEAAHSFPGACCTERRIRKWAASVYRTTGESAIRILGPARFTAIFGRTRVPGPPSRIGWRRPPADLPDDHPAWDLEAHYLAYGLANFACTLAPARILVGGGVMRRQHLYHSIRRKLPDILKEYVALPDVGPPGLGDRAGVLGALALAETLP